MLRLGTILAGAILGAMMSGPSWCAGRATAPDPTSMTLLKERIDAAIERGNVNPAADAAAAIRRGEFGLLVAGQHTLLRPVRVTCYTPSRRAPRVVAQFNHGDVIGPREQAWYAYASAYNLVVVEHPAYPDADLCRPWIETDNRPQFNELQIDEPARRIARPVLGLHEAARRGSAADVRRFLAALPIDGLDGLGMTALSWAVARNNIAAADALLAAGADPWVGEPGGVAPPPTQERPSKAAGAVYWAAANGRRDLFERLEKLPGRPFSAWPAIHVQAAIQGGDPAIVRRMLEAPQEGFASRLLFFNPLPSRASLEPLLEMNIPGVADTLLMRALGSYEGGIRIDLVRLALDHGANPNANDANGYETALGEAAKGYKGNSLEAVDLLVKAGADVNLPSHRQRPIWVAVQAMEIARSRFGPRESEVEARTLAVFERLLAAGADINLPNWEGRPPIWFLLFLRRNEPERLEPSKTVETIELLARRGMDVNAILNGKRVLGLIEAQAGPDSELAVTLRRLGARK